MRLMTVLFAAWLGTTSAVAADFSCSKVRVVVPYGAGGSADVATRLVVDRLTTALGPTFFVENKGGASGNLGTKMVADADPDGCTLLVNGTVIATFLDSYTGLKYEPFKDLTPVGGIGITPTIIVAAPSLPAKDLKSLVELSKSRPNGLSFANPGYGFQQHLATEEIAQRASAKFVIIPYKGGGPALTDLISARVDFGALLGGTTKPLIEQGKLKALAVLQDKRSVMLPDVPTAAEQGFPGLLGGVHFLLFAPGKTPPEIVSKISAALKTIVSDPAIQERFLGAGLEATPMTSAECVEAMQAIRNAYQPIIKKLNIKLN
ncbi:MAG: Bug family tripartite tricarboxylate transporter substrate binding protein [Pseudolabrys sp.]